MKKIELAFEIVNTMSQTRQYEGLEPYEMHEVNDMVQKVAARYNKEQLEAMLDNELKHQKNAKDEYYKEVFVETEEGKSMMDDMEATFEAWENDMQELTKRTVNEVLGDAWGLAYFNERSFTIALRDTNPATAAYNGGYHFGHKVEFYYGYDFTFDGEQEFKFEVNIGTMGNFNACGEDTQRDFYIGIGKLLASEKLNALKDGFKQYSDNLRELKAKYRSARNAYAERMTA